MQKVVFIPQEVKSYKCRQISTLIILWICTIMNLFNRKKCGTPKLILWCFIHGSGMTEVKWRVIFQIVRLLIESVVFFLRGRNLSQWNPCLNCSPLFVFRAMTATVQLPLFSGFRNLFGMFYRAWVSRGVVRVYNVMWGCGSECHLDCNQSVCRIYCAWMTVRFDLLPWPCLRPATSTDDPHLVKPGTAEAQKGVIAAASSL